MANRANIEKFGQNRLKVFLSDEMGLVKASTHLARLDWTLHSEVWNVYLCYCVNLRLLILGLEMQPTRPGNLLLGLGRRRRRRVAPGSV